MRNRHAFPISIGIGVVSFFVLYVLHYCDSLVNQCTIFSIPIGCYGTSTLALVGLSIAISFVSLLALLSYKDMRESLSKKTTKKKQTRKKKSKKK